MFLQLDFFTSFTVQLVLEDSANLMPETQFHFKLKILIDYDSKVQKQPSRGVPSKKCSENMQ